MPPAALLTLILLSAGIAVWALAGWRVLRKEPVIAEAPRGEAEWGRGVVIVMFCFLAFQLAMRLQSEWNLSETADQPVQNAKEQGGEPDASARIGLVRSACAYNAMLVGVLLLFLTEGGSKSARDFGLQLQHPAQDAAVGAGGFLASYPLVLLAVLLTAGLRSEARTHPFAKLAQEHPTFEVYFWIAAAVLITAPVAEELLFRVILQGWLRTKLPAYAAIAISSLLFCAVHGFPDSLALFPLALILGYVFEKRRSYLAVVVLHALFNAQTLLALMLSESDAQ